MRVSAWSAFGRGAQLAAAPGTARGRRSEAVGGWDGHAPSTKRGLDSG